MYCGKIHKQMAYTKRRDAVLDAEAVAADAERRRLLDALAFYADASNYVTGESTSRRVRRRASSAMENDSGRRARQALAEMSLAGSGRIGGDED
jgi:hypothetical protein